jgi:hypothetical protein
VSAERVPERHPEWDTEWAAVKAAETLGYLSRNYPEGLTSPALHGHQDEAHRAAVACDRETYLEALRDYCRAARSEAMRIRRAAS